ncbi:site-specific integrase [Staphylococcus pseudoxylosus]|uniref:tyrosine-type recombinase/integrase n=1 Tax=Staphylococcus pseudoxylosus TaxID=2282419 RepID=UPI002DC028D9|nr:tyrosine-type recombinase/integrase [Staphylococcus pseudoxylosus]MEB8088217.1 site-specific integrase [Staphylococcus pseudoxylosus]
MAVYKDKERNTWYYSIYYTDLYGKPKRKKKRGFKTKKACKLAESEMMRTIKPDMDFVMTYNELFEDRLQNSDLSFRTVQNRQQEHRNHIQNEFGNLPITKITSEQCRDLRKRLVSNDDISVGYAKSVLSGFKANIRHALKHGYLQSDPTLNVEPIKQNKVRKAYITREKFDELVYKMDNLNNWNPVMYRKCVQLLFYTGLRCGEAMPLTWNDFDYDKRELDINKTMELSNSKIKYGVAKTSSSLSVIPIPNHIAEMLNDLKRESVGPYIFGGEKPFAHSSIKLAFDRVFKEYNPELTLHSLRHSYATHLINNGVDIYVLMNLLRHSSIKQTVDTYSHLYADNKQRAMKVLE